MYVFVSLSVEQICVANCCKMLQTSKQMFATLCRSEAALGPLLDGLGPLLDALGLPLVCSGSLFGHLRGVLGRSCGVLGHILGAHLGRKSYSTHRVGLS